MANTPLCKTLTIIELEVLTLPDGRKFVSIDDLMSYLNECREKRKDGPERTFVEQLLIEFTKLYKH